MHLIQDRDQSQSIVNTVINLQLPQKLGNFLTSLTTVSFSGRPLFRGMSYLVS
jgi:hypothetical protein